MKRISAFTYAVLQLSIGGLAGLLLTSAPASAAEKTPDLELSAADELALNELAAMFGNTSPEYDMMTAIVGVWQDVGFKESISRSLAEIIHAIDTCGIDTDFAAPPPPTGDELFDAYAQAVDRQLNAMSFEQGIAVTQYGKVPDDLLAEWEPRFGNDPRYWELRYLLKVLEPAETPAADQSDAEADANTAGTDPRPAIDFLLEAQRRGCASANTLLLLYDEVRRENDTRLTDYSDYDGAQMLSSPGLKQNLLPLRPAISPQELAGAAAIHRENDAREQELLDAACFRGPDQAWPLYLRGLHSLSLGEYETGLADMQAGNAAPVNVYPRPFPIKLVEDSLLTSEPAGGPAVCGAIEIMLLSYPRPNYVAYKDDCRAAVQMAELGADVEIYDAWHHFACRMSASAMTNSIDSLVSNVLVDILRSGVVESHEAELTAEQLATLHRIMGAREEARQAWRHIAGDFDVLSAGTAATLAGGSRGLSVAFCLQASLETRTINDEILPVFADLAEISYLDLATPASMLKYEALTDEVYEARRLTQRGENQVNEVFSATIAQREHAGE